MAKKVSSARTKSPAKAEAKFKLFYPVLAECAFERNKRPDGASEEDKAERFYDSTVELPDEPVGKVDVAVCEFVAGQQVKETNILEVRATYFVGIECTGLKSVEEKRAILQEFVAASAWPMFRDLFIHIGSQSSEELPLLPNAPRLRWIGKEK